MSNYKPFDLQKALSGEKMKFLESDFEVAEIYYSKTRAGLGYAPIFVIATNGNQYVCWEDGRRCKGGSDPFDLVMALQKKTVWVNMWQSDGEINSTECPFQSKEIALQHIDANEPTYIGTYPIQIEL